MRRQCPFFRSTSTDRVFLAELAPGNLQVLWPEGNVIIRRGVVDAGGGVPDYNAMMRIDPAGPSGRGRTYVGLRPSRRGGTEDSALSLPPYASPMFVHDPEPSFDGLCF